jgi:hypothetical protein
MQPKSPSYFFVADEPPFLDVFHAALESLHRLLIREDVECFQKAIKVSGVDKHDSRFSPNLDLDGSRWMLGHLLDELVGAVLEIFNCDCVHRQLPIALGIIA